MIERRMLRRQPSQGVSCTSGCGWSRSGMSRVRLASRVIDSRGCADETTSRFRCRFLEPGAGRQGYIEGGVAEPGAGLGDFHRAIRRARSRWPADGGPRHPDPGENHTLASIDPPDAIHSEGLLSRRVWSVFGASSTARRSTVGPAPNNTWGVSCGFATGRRLPATE